MVRFLVIITACVLFSIELVAQNVGISTTNPDAKLDVVSSNSGILIPRLALTGTNDVATVPDLTVSELVYNTATAGSGSNAVTPGFYYWSGSEWVRIKVGVEGEDHDWYESGGTAPNSINDDIYTQGNVAIGKTSANAPLDVSGAVHLDVMPTFNVEGAITIGRMDGVDRTHYIKFYNNGTPYDNYMQIALHNGTVGDTIDVLTLHGDGSVQIDNLGSGIVTSDASGVLSVTPLSGSTGDVLLGDGTFGPGTAFGDDLGNHTATTDLNLSGNILMNGIASSTNIDHIWYDDASSGGAPGTWHFVADAASKANGNSRVTAGHVYMTGSSSDNYFAGNVAIGTTTADEKLHVVGNVKVSSLTNGIVKADGTGVLSVTTLTGSTNDVLLGDGTFGPGSAFGDNLGNHSATTDVEMNENDIYFRNVSGSVYGIGYNTWGGSQITLTSDNLITFTESDNNTIKAEFSMNDGEFSFDNTIKAYDADGLSLEDDGGNLGIHIEDGGEVGIGTNSPIAQLHVDGGRVEFTATTDANGTTGTGVLEISNSLRLDGNEIITNDNSTLYLQNDNEGDLRVDGTTLVVDASLNRVGIGEVSPASTLEVGGDVRITGDNSSIIYENSYETNDEWRLVYSDDFESGTEGWIAQTITSTGNNGITRQNNGYVGFSYWVRPSNGNDRALKKYYNLSGITFDEIKVEMTYYFLDSWDGETAWIAAGNSESYASGIRPSPGWHARWDHDWGDPRPSTNLSFYGDSGWSDGAMNATAIFHDNVISGGGFWLFVGASLNDGISDETFAIDNVRIYVR